MQSNLPSKKKLIAIVFALVVLVGVGITIGLRVSQKNTFGDGVLITNIKEEALRTKEPSPKEDIDYIQYELLETVNMNIDTPKIGSEINDAKIRAGTFKQTYSKENNVYTTSFIVDIESLQQSYQANYQWIKDKKRNYTMDEWGSNVRCLPKDKLIFGDFDCRDIFSVMGGEENSIIKHLPYSTVDYFITLDPKIEDTLNIVIITSYGDEKNDPDIAILKYKQDAMDWIRSIGFDPIDYTINYTIQRPKMDTL